MKIRVLRLGVSKLWHLLLVALFCSLPAMTLAATYANTNTSFSWVDPSAHNRVVWTRGASCSSGYAGAPIDDDITTQLPLGFTFNFGGVDYTQIQIMSNGRLQFNNGFCGYGTQSVGPPPTYPYPYPNSSVVRTMRVYGVDLDSTSSGATGICPTATCYVSYQSLGTAPNRTFVVTWVNVPEWGRTARTGSFNLQIILYETSNEFVYQFGVSSHPTGGSAQIGWELTTTDYEVWSTTVVPTTNSAVRFYIPSPVAEYRMDEATWAGAGTILNSVSGGTHASPVGTATALSGGGRFCGGGNIPPNTSTAIISAVDTGLDVDGQIGSSGSISFWYKSPTAWNGSGSQASQLLDASTVNNRWFYLAKQNGNGQLYFSVTDSANSTKTVNTTNNSIAANTWVHIGVTWNFTAVSANNRIRIYMNGVLKNTTTFTTTSALSASIGTLYLGDNRGSSIDGRGTGTSANGVIDQVRIYDSQVTDATMLRDYNYSYSCPAIHHYRLEHDGSALTCAAENITLKACADANCTSLYSGGTSSVTLSGTGWTTNPVNFTGSTIASLSITSPQTVTLGVSSATPTPTSSAVCFNGTTTNNTTACQLPFSDTGFIFSTIPTQTAGVNSAALSLQAIKKADNSAACTGAFTGNVAIDMASQCVNPASCAGKQVAINGTNIANNPGSAISSYTPVTLNFGANSIANFTLNYPDVGLMQLAARYDLGAGVYMTGNSNAFVTKPYGFTVTNIRRSADSFANPAAANATGNPFIASGDAFSATITAIANGGAATPNFGRELVAEGVSLSRSLVAPSGGSNGTLSNGSIAGTAFSAGAATMTTLSWDEVGIITLTPSILDGNYLGVGNITGTTSDNIGRFTPHHFITAITEGSLQDSCTIVTPFTYIGESFSYQSNPQISATAKNALGQTTQNYRGGFNKLTTGSFTITYPINDSTLTNVGISSTPATATLSENAATAGQTDYSFGADDFRYTKNNNALLAPFNSDLDIVLNTYADADGITANDLPLTIQPLGVSLRFGRIFIANAFGSELVALAVPMTAQQYSTNGFITNPDDYCSTGISLNLSNPAGNIATSDTTPSLTNPAVAGDFGLLLSAPGTGNDGSLDVTATVPSHLQFDWSTDGNQDGTHDDDPMARATFGIFKGSQEQIYMREVIP